jgi:hypothetical protein
MIMKHFLLIIFMLLSLGGYSQSGNKKQYTSFTGTVIDSLDRKPIESVAVKIDNQGRIYPSRWKFSSLVPYGEYTVTISMIGYRTFRRRITFKKAELRLDISLLNIAKELDEVVVSTQGATKNVDRTLLGVTPMSMKTIKKIPAIMGEVDVLRGIQMLPGVTSVGEAANGVNIRGGTTDQTLILLDDTPIFNPTHLFGLFSVFTPDAVSGVELYKGGIPARFGGRTASVLDVTLQNPSLTQTKLSGGISLVSNRLSIETPLIKNKLSMLVSTRGSFNDFLFQLGSERLKNIRANFYDIATKFFFQPNQKNTFTFSGYFSKDFFQTDLLGTVNNINATSTQYDYKSLNASLKWFHLFSSQLDWQTSAIYTNYQPKTMLPQLNSSNTVDITSAILYRQLKSELHYNPNEKHKLTGGISSIWYKISPGNLVPNASTSVNPITIPDENSIEAGIYGEDEMTVNAKLSVSFGLRYAQYWAMGAGTVRRYQSGVPLSDFTVTDSTKYGSGQVIASYGGLEPRISAKYSLTNSSSLKFGYNFIRQYLQVVSNTTTPLPTSRWATSNDYIRPQSSHLFSLGYFKNFKDNIYEFSMEGYYRRNENVLDYKPGADFILKPNLETQVLQGKGMAYGLEVMLSKKKGDLTGWLGYTYSRSLNQIKQSDRYEEQVNGGKWYPNNFDRPHSFNASLIIGQGAHHEFGFTMVYNTGRPFTVPTGIVVFDGVTYPFYQDRNNARISDYHRLDFSWTIRNPSMRKRRWEGSWTFTVYNLYGRKNAYSVYLRTEAGIKAYQLTIFGSPIPSLTYNFHFM